MKKTKNIKIIEMKRKNNYPINSIQTNYLIQNEISKDLINLNKNEKNLVKYNINELNNLSYNEALKIDKRTYVQYYLSLLKTKHILIFSFFSLHDYNSRIIKILLFFFSFIIFFAINALFFNDNTIHQIYVDNGSFNLTYQLPKIIYSSLISFILNIILKTLALSEKNVLKFKAYKDFETLDNRSKDLIKFLFYKFILFFVTSFIFLLFFWYYISAFCAVYENTQVHLVKDTFIGFGLSMLYPLGIYLIPGIFRIPALKSNKREKLYKFSKIIQLI